MTRHSTALLGASFALTTSIVAGAQAPGSVSRVAEVEKSIRAVGRVTGQPDSAYTIEERMRL